MRLSHRSGRSVLGIPAGVGALLAPPAPPALLAFLVLLLPACSGGEDVIAPETFVDVVVELREAERRVEAADTAVAAYEEVRADILLRHGVTEADLRRFVVFNSDDFRQMERVWERIENRLREVREDTTGATPPPPSGPGLLERLTPVDPADAPSGRLRPMRPD